MTNTTHPIRPAHLEAIGLIAPGDVENIRRHLIAPTASMEPATIENNISDETVAEVANREDAARAGFDVIVVHTSADDVHVTCYMNDSDRYACRTTLRELRAGAEEERAIESRTGASA